MKKWLKENIKDILILLIMIAAVSIELPYYIEAPGGTINLSKRIDSNYKKENGSLNMLYVREYKGNILTVLLSKVIKSWDLYEISNQQVSNETSTDIYNRNKIMLENSIDNATVVAYKEAGKNVEIYERHNLIIAAVKDNGFKVGDEIISIDNQEFENVAEIKKYISSKNENDILNIIIKRDKKEKELKITLDKDKLLGIIIVTNYKYKLDEELDIKFKRGEGGSSGGLVLALGIYQEITGVDLLKGRKIAGTGTIEVDGSIGEIDGIKYKIAGAVRDKVDIVLVSPYNYDEAKKEIEKNKYKIELVKVNNLKEAIEYLTK